MSFNQKGGSVTHKLYNKIFKSKNKDEAIKKEENKLRKKIDKIEFMKKSETETKEGFLTLKMFSFYAQFTTLKMIKDEPNYNLEDVISDDVLWAKLYRIYLLKKYNNDISVTKIASIIKRDAILV
jgi:stress response protein SCP2